MLTEEFASRTAESRGVLRAAAGCICKYCPNFLRKRTQKKTQQSCFLDTDFFRSAWDVNVGTRCGALSARKAIKQTSARLSGCLSR